MQRLSSFPRFVILAHAAELGLAFQVRRAWSDAEVETLRELLGQHSQSAVARMLGRTYQSVKWKIARLQLSSRIREGYSLANIHELFGVNSSKTERWIRRAWLRLENGRVSEREMRRFLLRHPEEYMLRRVDEAWFKDLIFSKPENWAYPQKRSRTNRAVGEEEPATDLTGELSLGSLPASEFTQ